VIHSLLIDDLTFSGRWSRRRRTIGISVGAAGELRVAAPVGCPQAVLEAVVRDKLIWVRKKLAEQEVGAAEQIRAYEAGKLFPYLGRRCPLRLVDDPELAVQLQGGRFELDRALARDGRAPMARLQSPTVAVMEEGTLRCDEADEPIRSCDGRR
jgi:predicted metal-dependent hydrolase